jgi:hypothetical protein
VTSLHSGSSCTEDRPSRPEAVPLGRDAAAMTRGLSNRCARLSTPAGRQAQDPARAKQAATAGRATPDRGATTQATAAANAPPAAATRPGGLAVLCSGTPQGPAAARCSPPCPCSQTGDLSGPPRRIRLGGIPPPGTPLYRSVPLTRHRRNGNSPHGRGACGNRLPADHRHGRLATRPLLQRRPCSGAVRVNRRVVVLRRTR